MVPYTTESSFQTAIGPNYAFDNFNDLGSGTIDAPSATRTNATYGNATYSAPGGLYSNLGAMSTNSASDPLTIAFSATNLTAVGAILYVSDVNAAPVLPYRIEVRLMSGSTVLVDNNDVFVTSTTQFLGYTSSLPITSMVVLFPASPNPNEFITVDNLYYTNASIASIASTAVPLPPSAVAALSLLPLAAFKRRKAVRSPLAA